jgi:AcrR family transcriptional regulator
MAQHSKTAKNDIAAAAYRLFLTNGYAATSYRDIAEAVGRDRALVQYHFPQKEALVVSCLRRLIDLIEHQIETHQLASRDPVLYRTVLAEIYFSFLMQPSIRTFTLDVLSSRAITHDVLVMESTWNLDFLGVAPAERQAAFDQAIIAVGGAYELMYRYLITGDELDIRQLAAQTIANSAVGRDAAVHTAAVSPVTDAQLAAAVAAVLEGFLS